MMENVDLSEGQHEFAMDWIAPDPADDIQRPS
jgi:hypothetical protein